MKKTYTKYADVLPPEVAIGGRNYANHWQNAWMNVRTYQYWFHRLRSLALSAFEWENVPEEIDPRFIELCMLDYGLGGFFDMSNGLGNYAFAQAAPVNRLNMYWNPNKVRFIPANGGAGWFRNAYWWTRALVDGTVMVEKPNAVVLYDNINRQHIQPMLMIFARRLAHLDRLIDINLHAQATPYIITAPETARRDALNAYKQVGGHEPVIFKNPGSVIGIDVLQTNAPYVADKLLYAQTTIFYQALDLLGIDNTDTNKRERMVNQEIMSNDEDISIMRRSRLYTRKQFCEKINDRFGLEMSVRYAVTPVDIATGAVAVRDEDLYDVTHTLEAINDINEQLDIIPDEGEMEGQDKGNDRSNDL